MTLIVSLIGCDSGTPNSAVPSEEMIQQTVDAAVALTVAANQNIETAVSQTVAASQPVAQVEPTPTLVEAVIAQSTAVSEATQPPPATSTPVPTSTPNVTHTPEATPEPTEAATETAAPPTSTSPPQPTNPPAPPADPTVPPNPVLSGNILRNGSFEDGWYNLNGIPELQLPNGWVFEWDEGATGFGSEEWDVWVRPETRVLPNFQLPQNERGLFIRDGVHTIKMFKGNGAISYRLMQDIELPAGTYVFKVNVYPDLVQGYDNGSKVFAGDPAAGELRFIAPGGGTGWFLPTQFGTWNTFEHVFSIGEAQTVRIGLGVRGRYALSNNGWFIDEWSLQRVEN